MLILSNIRGLFDKYPCLSTDDTTDAKSVCHYLTPSFKWWLQKFQTDSCCKSSSSCKQQPWRKSNRSVILFLFWNGKTCEEIKVKLHAVYKDHAPSRTTIRYWFNEVKHGWTSVFDEKRPGHPIEVTTVLPDRRVKIREIADIVDISTERIQNILPEKSGMRKLSVRWVPSLLTVEQKRNRITISVHSLDMFKRNPKDFLRRFVTVDEACIHHYKPEMKEQSK